MGSDEELKALHAVEAPIEAERGANRMPQLLAIMAPGPDLGVLLGDDREQVPARAKQDSPPNEGRELAANPIVRLRNEAGGAGRCGERLRLRTGQ